MYSGTTFRRDSGRIVGGHQKIDRVARRHLEKYIPKSMVFPGIRNILHFEGKNGPDGLKLKSPSQDEFDHSIDPTDASDQRLNQIIEDHIFNLSEALRNNNQIRASFETAWLAHAVVDGLTPAHHYPSTEKLKKMLEKSSRRRRRLSKATEDPGEISRRNAILKKWGSWGTNGVMTHVMFELGVASVLTTDNFEKSGPTRADIARLDRDGYQMVFTKSLQKIHKMKMYDEFCKKGWTRHLAVQTRKILVPEIINAVSLAWYQAIKNAGEQK